MDDKPTSKEIESFKRMILALVPAAQRIAKSTLQVRRRSKVKLEPKSVDFARWVLQQYAKFTLPDADMHEIHVIDHAMLEQMKQAQGIVAEMNAFRANRRATQHRGLDIEPN